MQGTTGRLFREFSLVVTGAVLISAFAALTFTPMLATKMLVRKERQSWFYRATEPFFDGMNRLYARTLAAFMRRRVRRHTGRAADRGDYLRALEPYPVRDGSARGPLVHIDQHARGRGDHLRVHARLYRGHQPSGRLRSSPRPRPSRPACRAGAATSGLRFGILPTATARRWRSPRSCRKPSDPRRWPVLSCSSKSTFGGRRGQMPDAVRAAGDQSREAPAGTARSLWRRSTTARLSRWPTSI